MVRTAIMTMLVCASFSLAACSGDDISQAELERERADAAQNARQGAEIKALQRELKSKEAAGSAAGSNSGAAPSPAQTPASGEIPGEARYCGSAYGAGSASCPFAENVSDDYFASGESGSFTSYSPTTGLTYTVTCNGDNPTVCTAGRAAVIYIP